MYGNKVHEAVLKDMATESSNAATESSNAAKASSVRAMKSSFLTAKASSATAMESSNTATESRNAADPVVGISGITIHLIDQYYDKGEILFQATCPVLQTDTVETLAQKVHALEYKHFPQITDQYITNNAKQHTK